MRQSTWPVAAITAIVAAPEGSAADAAPTPLTTSVSPSASTHCRCRPVCTRQRSRAVCGIEAVSVPGSTISRF